MDGYLKKTKSAKIIENFFGKKSKINKYFYVKNIIDAVSEFS